MARYGSTSLIAAEIGISACNLHYHFRRKYELSAAPFLQVESRVHLERLALEYRARR